MTKNLVFIIKTYQDFIRTNGAEISVQDRPKLNSFFEAVSDSYIPLLNMFERLEADKVNFKLGLVLPPVLCSMLDNPSVQDIHSREDHSFTFLIRRATDASATLKSVFPMTRLLRSKRVLKSETRLFSTEKTAGPHTKA